MQNTTNLYLGKFNDVEIHGYLIEELLTPADLSRLTTAFIQQFNNRDLIWDKTLINFGGRVHGMGRQRNDGKQRYVNIIDVSQDPEYYFQTADTVYEWADNIARNTLSPIFYKVIKIVESLGAVGQDPGKWVMIRSHINVHEWEHCLEAHVDMDMSLFNCEHEYSKQYSVTVYLDELSLGGEFWAKTDIGFVYKPRTNTALMIPGNKFVHGVNANMDEHRRPRKAYTMRFAHVDTLYLPGHPDKCLYQPSSMDQITA